MSTVLAAASCESRAFFLIDAVEPGCLIWLQRALLQLGNLLSLGLNTPPPLGLAVMKRMPGKQSSQCNILLRPGPSFQLREYCAAVKRVAAAEPSNAADGSMLGAAVMALLQHMMKQPGGTTCHNHVIVISSTFQSSPKMQQVFQFTRQVRASIHFLQLIGPSADELDQQMSDIQLTDGPDQVQHTHQQQLDHKPAHAVQFEQAIAGFAPDVTFDYFAADCSAVSDLLCQCWLRELMTHSTSKNLSTPDIILKLGQQQQLACTLHQHILPLDPWIMPARLCPCHQQPMQPPAGSAAAAQAATAAASDPASAAGLLLLPEEVPWRCQVSGQLILQVFSNCSRDSSVMQLGRHTQIRMSAAAVKTDSRDTPLAAAAAAFALPIGQPMELTVQHVVGINRIDSMMLYGVPFIVSPAACSAANTAAAADSTAAVAQATTAPREDDVMFLRALCELLIEQQQVLLASSHHDIIRRCYHPLKQWYILQPAADGCSLLLRYMASREQLLPPRGYKSMVAGDPHGEVVLLDAGQLEAARGCLAQLQQPPSADGAKQRAVTSWSESSDKVGAVDADNKGQLQQHDVKAVVNAAAAGGHAHSEDKPITTAAAVRGSAIADDDKPGSSSDVQYEDGPLLPSCGLHEWMQTIIDSCAATYQPPAGAAAAARNALQPNIQAQQQQPAIAAAVPSVYGGQVQVATSNSAALRNVTAPTASALTAAAAAGTALGVSEQQQQQQQYFAPPPPPMPHNNQQSIHQEQQLKCPPTVQTAPELQHPEIADARCVIQGVTGKTTTAAHVLEVLQTDKQSNTAQKLPGAAAAGETVSGRALRRGRGRNALKLSSSGVGSRHAG